MILYVYYTVQTEAAEAALPLARALLAEVAAATGVTGRLLRRAGDPSTWMEIYDSVGADFPDVLAALCQDHPLLEKLAGSRHPELFEPFPGDA